MWASFYGHFLTGVSLCCLKPCIGTNTLAPGDEAVAPRIPTHRIHPRPPVPAPLPGTTAKPAVTIPTTAAALRALARRTKLQIRPLPPPVTSASAHKGLKHMTTDMLTPRQRSAHARLRKMLESPVRNFMPDVVAPIVEDLDCLLFGRMLAGHLIVSWGDLSTSALSAAPQSEGKNGMGVKSECRRLGLRKVNIRLNRAICFAGNEVEIVGMLVREMLRAWVCVMTLVLREGKGAKFEATVQALMMRLTLSPGGVVVSAKNEGEGEREKMVRRSSEMFRGNGGEEGD